MRIVGIDPDTKAVTLVSIDGAQLPISGAGLQVQRVETKGRLAEDRFAALVTGAVQLLDGLTEIAWVYVEKPMLTRNAKSTLDQALIVGAIRAHCITRGLSSSLLDPGVWKRALLGNGHASKDEIRAWALAFCPSLDPTLPQDAYDAVCIARYGLLQLGGA